MRKTILALGSVFLASPLAADALSDLRKALTSLPARSEITATAVLEVWIEDEEEKKTRSGNTTVELRDGAAGVSITYPRAELQRAREERRKPPDDPRPTLTAIMQLDALPLQEQLDFASSLAQTLERAKVTEQAEVTFQGKPARMLKFQVDTPMPASARKRVKQLESTLQLWIEPDGIPIAGRTMNLIKASFLLMKFEGRQTESLTFTRVSDRLIVTEREEEQSSSGFGQTSRTRKVTKLQLR